MKKVIITTIIVILICLALIAICSYIKNNVENKNNYTIAAELNGFTSNGMILKDTNGELWEVPDVFLLGQNKFILRPGLRDFLQLRCRIFINKLINFYSGN